MKCVCCVPAIALALCGVLPAAGQTADAIDPAQWVPGEVLAYVGVADIEQFAADYRRTALFRMTQELDARDLPGSLSVPMRLLESFRGRVARALDLDADKIENPFGGPMAVYATVPRAKSASDVEIVFVAGIGDATLMRTTYDRVVEKLAAQAGTRHEAISSGSYILDHFARETHPADADRVTDDELLGFGFGSQPQDDELGAASVDELLGRLFSPDAMPDELTLCLADDRLVCSSSPERVKEVLQREESHGSFADSDVYKTLVREFQPAGPLRLWINVPRLCDMMVAAEGDKARQALALLGVNSVRGVIGHACLSGEGFESKTELLLLLAERRTGLARIFSMPNRDVAAPRAADEDSVLIGSISIDLMGALDELERMIRLEDPVAADNLHALVGEMPVGDNETLNLRRELLENLSGLMAFTLRFQQPYGRQSPRFCLALGHKDRSAMARFLEKLNRLLPGTMVEREIGDTVAYDLGAGGVSIAPGDESTVICSSDTMAAMLPAAGASGQRAGPAGFERAAALAPQQAGGVLYVDSRRLFETALELFKVRDTLFPALLMDPANVIAVELVEVFTRGLDAADADAARDICKYLAPSIITVSTTPEGIRLTQIDLTPAGK